MDTINLKDFFICSECGAILKLNDRLFMAYFTSGNILCSHCDKPIDLWKTFKNLLDPPMMSFAYHYSLLGCINKSIKLMIKPNELTELDLSEEIGNGDLLYISYTTRPGGTFPIETHTNIPISHLKVKNKKYKRIYPMDLSPIRNLRQVHSPSIPHNIDRIQRDINNISSTLKEISEE